MVKRLIKKPSAGKAKPILIPNKPKRFIDIGDESTTTGATQREHKERAAINVIMRNPRYNTILASLREGLKIPKISEWFATNGWIDVSEKTFTAALYIFRKRNVAILNSSGDTAALDALMEGNRPDIDVEVELSRLLRIQKQRIAIDYEHERNMRKLLPTTHKEFLVAAELIDRIVKSRGQGTLASDVGDSFNAFPVDVRDNLREIKTEEAKVQRLHSLTQQIANKVLKQSEKLKETDS